MTKQELITALNNYQTELENMLNNVPNTSEGITAYRTQFELIALKMSIYQMMYDAIKMVDGLTI